jgi:hypothetical protein
MTEELKVVAPEKMRPLLEALADLSPEQIEAGMDFVKKYGQGKKPINLASFPKESVQQIWNRYKEAAPLIQAFMTEARDKYNKWVPIEKVLPDFNKSVLLLAQRDGQQIECIGHRQETSENAAGYMWLTTGEDMWIEGIITHWMPLPVRPN